MSYDYHALVEEISKNRLAAAAAANGAATTTTSTTDDQLLALQAAMDAFATLSSHCPMTPRLWMQYAYDAFQFMLKSSEDSDALLATSTRLNILELGLNEFPGCAMLQFHYLELLAATTTITKTKTTWKSTSSMQQDDEEDPDDDDDAAAAKFEAAFSRAVMMIGSGSHRNEDMCWIVNLYRLGAFYFAHHQHSTKQQSTTNMTWYDVFVQRSQTPMQHGNEGLMAEFLEFAASQALLSSQQIATLQATMDGHRRSTASLDLYLARFEEEVDVAMQAEGILARPHQIHITKQPELGSMEHEEFWKEILQEPNPHMTDPTTSNSYPLAWMGLGGIQTARSFVRYAQALAKYRVPKNQSSSTSNSEAQVHKIRHHLAMSVYERGVAECPTVESLWLAYINHVMRYVEGKVSSPTHNKEDGTTTMTDNEEETVEWDKYQSVALRATRNCPYSVKLLQQRMKLGLLMANANVAVLDPDTLMTLVQQALTSGFIVAINPDDDESGLELYLTAIRIVQRRILFLLNKAKNDAGATTFDAAVFPAASSSKTADAPTFQKTHPPLNPELEQELDDLCDDLREMYDTADQYFRPKDQVHHQASASKARFILWKDRSRCERDLLGPCEQVLRMSEQDDENQETRPTLAAAQSVLAFHDQWIRGHQPPHPDAYASYIEAVRTVGCMTMAHPVDVIVKLQWIRALYQKGLAAAAGVNATAATLTVPTTTNSTSTAAALWSLLGRDYELALRKFCQDYMEFEHLFGSDESYEKATQAIFKKRGAVWAATPTAATIETQPMENDNPSQATNGIMKSSTANGSTNPTLPPAQASDGKKRKLPENALDDVTKEPMPKKKVRMEDALADTDGGDENVKPLQIDNHEAIQTHLDISMDGVQLETPTNNDAGSNLAKKEPLPKVRIGKLEYPAHPFTVRVSNLSSDTEDMDLVDVFRPKCGPVVHAKIIRDKHPPHESKGWGLIQFEDREAVEKALALHDVIGINERLAQVERSHMPAATLVPPGKHRVKPKGEGKSSKRNQKRKTGKHDEHNDTNDQDDAMAGQQQGTDTMDAEPTEPNALPTKGAGDKAKTPPPAAAAGKGNVFAFRPRNLMIGHKTDHRKVKLALNKNVESQQQG